jgi:hypothetical protein
MHMGVDAQMGERPAADGELMQFGRCAERRKRGGESVGG